MKNFLSLYILVLAFGLTPSFLWSQFAPPAGQPGTTAIHRDSSAIIGWAVDCEIIRGYINMADTSITYNGVNKTTYGSYLYASGPSDEYVVSLGDHGMAILRFDPPVRNNIGPDFAVFENSFSDTFLELAFVEVSSDGENFFRFPAISHVSTTSQIGTFATMDATLVHNFAGKYRMGYGTPFDLEEMKAIQGLDVNHITHIRIVDVGGCIDPLFAAKDSEGNTINDPWPTPFDTGGFDLDAIGVLSVQASGSVAGDLPDHLRIYPNPVENFLNIELPAGIQFKLEINTMDGKRLGFLTGTGNTSVDMTSYQPGFYIARLIFPDGSNASMKIIK